MGQNFLIVKTFFLYAITPKVENALKNVYAITSKVENTLKYIDIHTQ